MAGVAQLMVGHPFDTIKVSRHSAAQSRAATASSSSNCVGLHHVELCHLCRINLQLQLGCRARNEDSQLQFVQLEILSNSSVCAWVPAGEAAKPELSSWSSNIQWATGCSQAGEPAAESVWNRHNAASKHACVVCTAQAAASRRAMAANMQHADAFKAAARRSKIYVLPLAAAAAVLLFLRHW
jgi:hypothetical protein